MLDRMKTLDPFRLSLKGEQLIEASAGTGKTYTIIILYLRFLLGLGDNSSFNRFLTVKEILVVTFTKAATEELVVRIRKNIRELRLACLHQFTNNSIHSRLLDMIQDKHKAAQWLLLAERQMDESAIFTIHGFCQKMLNLHSFKSGTIFEKKIMEKEESLHYQACADFWRRFCYPLPREIAEIIYKKWKGPKDLLKDIELYLQGEMPIIKSSISYKETITTRHQKIITLINNFKKKWISSCNDIEKIIAISSIDRQKFNYRNQIKWMEEINRWTREKTKTYQIPKELRKFSQRFLTERTQFGGLVPKHPLFTEIEILFSVSTTLYDLVILRAITEIRDIIACEKKRLNKVGFDDILTYLDSSLASNNGEKIALSIRTLFPVVMIDEFQDTDPKQYRIFRRIWFHKSETAVLVIGDPKQAIYSFRGADIFTYMQARSEIQSHYTMKINWRSSPGMVESINTLFQRQRNPFLFQDIPFVPLQSSDKNANLRFEYQGKIIPAMKIWLMEGENHNVDEYRLFMAKQCAMQIRDWLSAGQRGKALLWSGENSKVVEPSDIAVLVRSYQEAIHVRDALAVLDIPSVYLSNRDSVFKTLEAKEILWILQGVLSKKAGNFLRCALSTSMFGLNTRDLDTINKNENALEEIIEEFNNYRERWHKHGVMAMLRELMMNRCIAENIIATPGGKRRLTNILHISELLQETSYALESEYALVRWLEKHITNPNKWDIIDQKIRLESDGNLVQIVTIHKSKGMEYPLVWIPFVASYTTKNKALYHDRVSFKAIVDFSGSEDSIELAKVERLAEDLRLLYVALTRSVWHCSFGISPLGRKYSNKTTETTFHRSAIGYLIQKGRKQDAAGLRKCLQSVCNTHIELYIPVPNDSKNFSWKNTEKPKKKLQARCATRSLIDNWSITSYSSLQEDTKKKETDYLSKISVNTIDNNEYSQDLSLTMHTFPRGVIPGTFLHNLFESLDFTQPISEKWVCRKLKEAGYEAKWNNVIVSLIASVLYLPLINNTFTLNQLDTKNKLVEMEFFLPIKETITSGVLDNIVKRYDSLSRERGSLNFHHIHGMLKGFIDLIFYHQGRYYLLDYKSNWLGENIQDYDSQSILSAMQVHHYDLQYQLYTLALHRYLRQRIINYDYQTHFGSVMYLFLRGIKENDPQSGVFTVRPDREFINELDLLFG